MIKKLHFKTLSLTAILILLNIIGCKKEDAKSTTAPTTSNRVKVNSAGDNKYDLLGYGYDVTGTFASSNSSTYKIIDIEKLVSDDSNRFVPDDNVEQTIDVFAGGNGEDYIKSKASNYGLNSAMAGIFSADFKGNYYEASTISSKYSYASASIIIKQKRLKFSAPIDLIKSNYLTSTFTNDVNSMTPQQLVTKYGTHVLTDIILGAKLDMYYRSQSTSANRGEAAKSAVTVNILGGIFGFNITNSYKDSTIKSNYNQTLYYHTVGGDGTKGIIEGPLALDNKTPQPVNISNWQSTCTRSNAAFIKFGGDKDHVPFILLSDLISDATKKAAVKSYIDQYLADHAVTVVQDYTDQLVNINSFAAKKGGDHYLTTGTVNDYNYWNYIGSPFRAYPKQVPGSIQVNAYFSQQGVDHLFTTGTVSDLSWWKSEGVAFYAFTTKVTGTIAVYSHTSKDGKDHYYSTDSGVLDANYWSPVVPVAFYAYPANIN